MHGTVQYCTIQYNTIQYTVYYNTVQYSTVHYTHHVALMEGSDGQDEAGDSLIPDSTRHHEGTRCCHVTMMTQPALGVTRMDGMGSQEISTTDTREK